jgi:hypothetical protein
MGQNQQELNGQINKNWMAKTHTKKWGRKRTELMEDYLRNYVDLKEKI